jgi:Flp pilus assembly protein TadD
MAYAQLSDYKTTIQNCAKAEQFKPYDPEVLNNLAWLLSTTGDVTRQNADKAVEFARLACELTAYKNADFLDSLGVAYAAAGKYTDAIITSEKALKAAQAAGRKDLAAEIQNRMKLYKAGEPYRGK